jgi:long-subunit fatty acid transport protein
MTGRLISRLYLLSLVLLLSQIPTVFAISSPIGGISATPTRATPTGSFWNPALIGLIPGTELEANVSMLGGWFIYDRDGIDPNTNKNYESSTTSNFVATPYLGLSSNLGTQNFRLGYSTYFPGGAAARFDKQGAQRYDFVEGLLLPWNHQLTLAYSPSEKWSIAASAIYSVAFMEANLTMDLAPFVSEVLNSSELPAEHPSLGSPVNVPLSSAHSYGFALGAYYSPNVHWSFGISAFSPIRYTFNSELKLGVPSFLSMMGPGLAALKVNNQITNQVTAKTSLPGFLQMGFRYQPFGFWNGEYFGRYTFNSFERSMNLEVKDSPFLALEDYNLKGKKFKDSMMIGTVQTFAPWKKWKVGFSASFYKNAVPKNQLSVSHSDFDSILTGAFGSYKFSKRIHLGVEYAHSFMFNRQAQGTAETESRSSSTFFKPMSTDGTYRASMDRLGVTLKYAF